MGGLVVQRALARYAARAAVLVAPVPAHPAVSSLAAIARRHPLDALRIVGGGSLPLRPDYLFHELDEPQAQAHADRCGGESAVVQYQLLLHRPARPPLGRRRSSSWPRPTTGWCRSGACGRRRPATARTSSSSPAWATT